MQLSTLEEEILEKAAGDCGTSYGQHSWVSRAEFLEAAEHLVALYLLKRQSSKSLPSIFSDEFQTYRKVT